MKTRDNKLQTLYVDCRFRLKTLDVVITNYWLKFYVVDWEENIKFLTLKYRSSAKNILRKIMSIFYLSFFSKYLNNQIIRADYRHDSSWRRWMAINKLSNIGSLKMSTIRSYILKQTCTWELQVCLSMYGLLVDIRR